MNEPDEYTPRERGLLLGHALAQKIARGGVAIVGGTPGEVLDALAGDPPQVPSELYEHIMDGMAERLADGEDPDAEEAFWAGFVHGVRAFLVELQIGTGDN